MLPAILFVRGGLSYAHNEKKTKLLPSWDARLLICCEASVCWDGARERTDVHRRIPSLPHICYTRRHLHPRLPVESAENKFGSVQFFKKSWKVFCEYWKKYIYLDTHLASYYYVHPSVEQYGLVTLLWIILNNKVFVVWKTWEFWNIRNTFRPGFFKISLFNKCFSCSSQELKCWHWYGFTWKRKPTGNCGTSCFVSCKDLNIRLVLC